MSPIHIRVLRHSAFYSPLLLSISAGYLARQGLTPEYDVATAQKTVPAGIASGEVQVAQSAVATAFAGLERGEPVPVRHFAQINERDGFFLTRRQTGQAFAWSDLVGQPVLVDHFFQPLAMFRYALHKQGMGLEDLQVIDAGDVEAMDRAYRDGSGAYIHQQGPYAQQLEADGLGEVVAAIGEVIGPVAFSSLCASQAWLQTDMAQAFMAVYRQGLASAREMPAQEMVPLLTGFFPHIDPAVLARTIQSYQQLGCWQPEPAISEMAFETTLDVFSHSGQISRRYAYEEICCRPPDEAA